MTIGASSRRAGKQFVEPRYDHPEFKRAFRELNDSVILDDPIQIDQLANRPPWLAAVMEDFRHYDPAARNYVVTMRGAIEVKGVRRPARWSCAQPANADGSLSLKLKARDDPSWRKGI